MSPSTDPMAEATGRKYPEWIVLVCAYNERGMPNIMTAGWSMFTSGQPRLYAVSVGLERYTHELLLARREWVIAVPGAGMGAAVRHCGTRSGREGDKVRDSGLTVKHAARVNAPLVEGALLNFECRYHSHHRTGDHTIFIGEIIHAHYLGGLRSRLMNFGFGDYAVARIDPETIYHYDA